MAKLQRETTRQPTSTRARWEKRIAGPNTIHKLMEGKVSSPTIKLLINAPSAISNLNPNDPSISKKVLHVGSAWETFFNSASPEELECGRPPFLRFIDAVEHALENAKSKAAAEEMLRAITLPPLLMEEPTYILSALFRVFSANPNQDKGTTAFAHLEANSALLFTTPQKLKLNILRGILEFYEQNPDYLLTPQSRECARSISGLLFAYQKYLLHSNNIDLLAFGLSWAAQGVKDKISLMGIIADRHPQPTQTILFSKVAELVPLMPIYRTEGKELYSERFKFMFPHMCRVQTNLAALSIAQETVLQDRLEREAKRHLNATGRCFLANDSQTGTIH